MLENGLPDWRQPVYYYRKVSRNHYAFIKLKILMPKKDFFTLFFISFLVFIKDLGNHLHHLHHHLHHYFYFLGQEDGSCGFGSVPLRCSHIR